MYVYSSQLLNNQSIVLRKTVTFFSLSQQKKNMASKSGHLRSISLPSRSHPTTLKIEEELNKFTTFELASYNSSGSICNALCRLAELYQCMDALLNLPSTTQALSQQSNQKLGDEFVDGSLRILDVCGITREIVSQFKENVRDLQSSLRRRKGDSGINNYACFRKKMKNDAKRYSAALKQIDASSALLDLDDQHTSAVIRVLREVYSISVSIFQSVWLFLSGQSTKPKTSKWALVSRLVHKEKAGCEDHQQEGVNELENVDSAVNSLCRNDQSPNGKIQIVQSKLESLEATIESMENGLEGMFRCLIRSRTTLLNIFSC
ncbi:OLC1v1011156C1 [Oldenlandia corymbosa var. corymbosa]|uniref:OLC1v1011156C1 n=1 Tax=Oldenlandia corymbosa var. corymbosa TaxID=529605 RepID=A0AAV1DSX5_OLDCO|nr:OLC1v1011156C1 [Oldenlandia corymbosa var. corymbosa]